jgi:glucose/arabinose dehydrogenase
MSHVRRHLFAIISLLLAFGGVFGALGVNAQEGNSVSTTAQPGGDLPGDPGIELVQVASGFLQPINVASAPDGTGRIFVVERMGTIRIVQDGQVLPDPFLDISAIVKTDHQEQGLLGLAFHPDYATNGRFFIFYSDFRTNGDHFLVEYAVSADNPNVADPESGRLLLSEDDPFTNHNGGTITFGPDGYLYVTIGDGGMAGDPYDNAQDLSNVLGKILRIDVNVEPDGPVPYVIPADNPFADAGIERSEVANPIAQTGDYRPDARPEIYHYGLRNAWQFSFDSETGDMYIADVGQVAWEEINFVAAGTGGGLNFGWDHMEASHCYPPDPEEGCKPFGELPVAEYNHEVGGCSITGIGVYRGEQSPSLDGIYFAGDYCTGKIWGLQRDDAGTWQFQELFTTTTGLSGAGHGEDGELYVTLLGTADTADGSLWQIVATEGGATPAATPAG